ncbi:PREDICTED: rhodopsin, GQ-coupled-like [Amphimedon queenslandica]|uniref:G-protein coupled receptors family 1 profile domain-containing protein n=1 Tax=Amphimedon queenslandica TaxID=400682 RepID=A0AAN0IN12_AMPQE|nr:PREDICTED: rhodopsin, GQ-coupled-like [Amphimedon queenslandica]|eukprot:XP_011404849.1 PREDICTED: rhodopsin, GQ-coupled-like [Amphimedon queenslandica]
MSLLELNSTTFTATGEVNGPAFAAAFAIEGLIGLIANITVLAITLYQRKSWKQSSTVFFTSFLLANIITVMYMLVSSISIGAGEWIIGSTFEEKRATCTFTAYVIWLDSMALTMTIAAISFDRFLFIVKPHRHKYLMKSWIALIVTISLWVLSAVVNIAPFYSHDEYKAGIYDSQIGICLKSFSDSYLDYIYFFLDILFLLIIDFIILVTSLWTFCFTCRFMQTQSEMPGNNSVYVSKKWRLFGIFGTMLLAYIIAVIPAYIFGVISIFYTLPPAVNVTAALAYGSIVISNPIIQSYFRPDIKIVLTAIIKKIKLKVTRRYQNTTQTDANMELE